MVERKSYVNNHESIVIPGWMINRFYLKGNNLLVFAIIYGFTQDGESWFEESLKYLANRTNSTRDGVLRNLKSLVNSGLIEPQYYWRGKTRMVKYRVNLHKTKSYLRG